MSDVDSVLHGAMMRISIGCMLCFYLAVLHHFVVQACDVTSVACLVLLLLTALRRSVYIYALHGCDLSVPKLHCVLLLYLALAFYLAML